MTTRIPRPENKQPPSRRIHPQQGQILLQDEILGYIAYRRQNDASGVTISKELGMTDGWVSDITSGKISVAKQETRETCTAKLLEYYGEEGIPVMNPAPTIVAAKDPPQALHEGFGRHAGDPQRPLAMLQEAAFPPPSGGTFDGITEEDAAQEIEAEIASLIDEKTPEELAGLLVQARDHIGALEDRIGQMKVQILEGTTEVARVQQQFTSMDNTRIRLGAEIAQRDRTIRGQAEDMVQYERSMDLLQQKVDELQGFKDGTITQLRQFAALLWQVVPPEGWPQVQTDYRTVGTETGRFSSTEANKANVPYLGELGGAAYKEYIRNLHDAEPVEVEFELAEEWKPQPIKFQINGVETILHCATEEEELRLRASLDTTPMQAEVAKFPRDALDMG